jgi:exoribonuclease-2
MNTTDKQHRAILQRIARRVMLSRGLLPDFSAAALAELGRIVVPTAAANGQLRDLRHLLWASIDNDDSRDLDQLTVADALSGDKVKVLVAVADVDAVVHSGSAIDEHARRNTTSVYTAATVFPMLPERLSTDVTSLNAEQDRLAIVVEMVIGADGSLEASDVYRAWVRNRAKLAYHGVAAWLEAGHAAPEAVTAVAGLAENLRLQDKVAQRMKNLRQQHGALSLETLEAKPIFAGDEVCELAVETANRATDIIADFMIAANGVAARYLSSKAFPSLRRVVRTPKRWPRIVEIAAHQGVKLPDEPDSKALEAFLIRAKAADPQRFPDLSLSVIKLLGAGEYVAEAPGDTAPGHFGLAVADYTHSTAPNRRYPDIITQRQLKAALAQQAAPYDRDVLGKLAEHCTRQEDAAKKVERQVGKSAAAMLLESSIGQRFDALVTGAADKGTWVRLLTPAVEGKLVQGREGCDVGQRVRVELIRTDVEQGFIDFKRVD